MYLEAIGQKALYNHKAILIAPERDLIAFPAENGYAIYGYSTKTGFYPKATVEGISTGAPGYPRRLCG